MMQDRRAGPARAREVRWRGARVGLWVAVLLCMVGWPQCSSQAQDGSQQARVERQSQETVLEPAHSRVAAMVSLLRQTARDTGSVTQSPLPSSQQLGISAAPASTPFGRPGGRRGLQSRALRMLEDLAALVLPNAAMRPTAVAPRPVGGVASQFRRSGGWVDTYVCLLNMARDGLHAERLRQEGFEKGEDGERRTELDTCRSGLDQIERDLDAALQDRAAIAHSLGVWERIGQLIDGQSLEAEAEARHDVQAKATTNVDRLRADRRQNDLNIRGLKVNFFAAPFDRIFHIGACCLAMYRH